MDVDVVSGKLLYWSLLRIRYNVAITNWDSTGNRVKEESHFRQVNSQGVPGWTFGKLRWFEAAAGPGLDLSTDLTCSAVASN